MVTALGPWFRIFSESRIHQTVKKPRLKKWCEYKVDAELRKLATGQTPRCQGGSQTATRGSQVPVSESHQRGSCVHVCAPHMCAHALTHHTHTLKYLHTQPHIQSTTTHVHTYLTHASLETVTPQQASHFSHVISLAVLHQHRDSQLGNVWHQEASFS